MRKSLAALIITVVVGSTFNSVAAANPKPGAACSKLKQTQTYKNLKFTCVKNGKKLVWNSGVSINVQNPVSNETPVVTPTATPSPSPTTPAPTYPPVDSAIPKDSWPDIRNLAMREFFANVLPASSSFSVNIQSEPSVTKKNIAYVDEAMSNVKNYLSGYFPANTKANLISVATQDWGYKTIMSLDPNNQKLSTDMKSTLQRQNPENPNCAGGQPGAGGGFAISYLAQPTVVLTIMNCDLVQVGTPPHEFTHSAQINYIAKSKVIDPNPACYGPSWLREGQAEVGNIILSYWNGKEQSLWSFKDILGRMEDPRTKSLQTLENDDSGQQQYKIGAFASLYLSARSGWNKSLEVWAESAKLAGRSCAGSERMKYFAQAFKNVYGQSLTDFYSEVTPYLEWLYDNQKTFLISTDIKQQPGEVKFQLNESCHGYNAQAVLQKKEGSAWVDAAPVAGWIPATCTDKYLPFAYAKFTEQVTLRWKVFAPGAWEWFSTEFVYKP